MDNLSIKRKKRTGFTLVELLVVIAILAVLASVSVIGYLSFVKKARVSNDVSLTTQMNTVLASNEVVDGKNATPYDAISELDEDGGFDVNKISPTANGHFFGFDTTDNRMVLFDEGMNVVAPEGKSVSDHKRAVFLLVGTEDEMKESKYSAYSFYLKNGFVESGDNVINVSTGVDTGTNEIGTVNYKNTTSTIKDVLIRSNGGTVTINAPDDEVDFYGYATKIDCQAIKPSSLNINDKVDLINVKKGNVKVTKDSEIKVIHVEKNANENENTYDTYDTVIVTLEDGASMPTFTRDETNIDKENGTKVCTVKTSEQSKDIYLFQNGIYEQIKVADSESDNGDLNWIDESNANDWTKKVADELANNWIGSSNPTFTDESTRTLSEENAKNVITSGKDSEAAEKMAEQMDTYDGDYVFDNFSVYELQNDSSIYDKETKTVIIPKGVKTLGCYLFWSKQLLQGKSYCLPVSKVILPDSLEIIGDCALYGGNFPEIVWPRNCKIKYIGNGAFNYCQYLTEITIPDGVEYMGLGVFANCTSLKKVSNLPSSVVENIPQNMFTKCPLVVSENEWLKNIKTIGAYAFNKAFASGETLDFSNNNLTSIGDYAFKESNLSKIVLPDTLKTIGDEAFSECGSLTDLKLSNKLETIGNKAFYNCKKLTTEIKLPDTLKSVGNNAFQWCTSLKKVTLAAGNSTYGEYVFASCSTLETLVIPEGCTNIGDFMFYKLPKLKEVSFPSTLQSVGKQAFKECTSLEKVKLAANNTDYGDDIFRSCSILKEVEIPEGCTTIGIRMFRDCTELRTLNFPSTLTAIKEEGFKCCTGLSGNVYIPSNVEIIENNAFRDITNIRCAASSKPDGWASGWCNKTVTWEQQNKKQ